MLNLPTMPDHAYANKVFVQQTSVGSMLPALALFK